MGTKPFHKLIPPLHSVSAMEKLSRQARKDYGEFGKSLLTFHELSFGSEYLL